MKCTIQVVITTDAGQTETREIACLERADLTTTTLGLTLAEGKALLKALQEVVIERQMTAYLATQRPCAHCGTPQRSKGYHTTQIRTVFGTIPVHSPRLHHCPCQSHMSKTFSPLAALLPDPTTPELLFLETKWAALVSYGMTAQLLHDVLPIDDTLAPCTIREHVFTVATRLEDALGEEQWSFIDSCPAVWSRLPIPDGPLTVGIDGGYVRAYGKQGQTPPDYVVKCPTIDDAEVLFSLRWRRNLVQPHDRNWSSRCEPFSPAAAPPFAASSEGMGESVRE